MTRRLIPATEIALRRGVSSKKVAGLMKVMVVRRISDAGYDRIAFEASEELAQNAHVLGVSEPIVATGRWPYNPSGAIQFGRASDVPHDPAAGDVRGTLYTGPRGPGSPSAEDAAAGCWEVM